MTNCANWMEVKKKTEDKLDGIQDLFGKVVLQMPQSTPKLSIRAARGLLGSRHRIWQQKVLLVLAIWQQEEGSQAREVLEEQVRMGWPGRFSRSAVRLACQMPLTRILALRKLKLRRLSRSVASSFLRTI